MLGRNVEANLRRLERLLASASPELRRRVVRLVRSEIRRLERGGVNRQERRRIERLERVLELARPAWAPTAASPGPTGGLVPAGSGAGRTAREAETSAGVLGTRTSSPTVGGEEPQARPIPPFPEAPDRLPSALGLLLLALALGLVGLIAAVTNYVLERRSGYDS